MIIRKNPCIIHTHVREYDQVRRNVYSFLKERKKHIGLSSKGFLEENNGRGKFEKWDIDKLAERLDSDLFKNDQILTHRNQTEVFLVTMLLLLLVNTTFAYYLLAHPWYTEGGWLCPDKSG